MSAYTKKAWIDGATAAALSLFFGALLVLFPVLALVTIPLVTIPIAFLTTRYGLIFGLMTGLVTAAGAMVLAGTAAGFLIGLLVVAVGTGAGLCVRLGFSQLRLFICLALIFFASLVLWLGVLLAMAGKGPVAATDDLMDSAAVEARDIYTTVGFSSEDVEAGIEQAREFAGSLPYLSPSILVVTSLLLSAVTLIIARRVFERRKQPFPHDFVFRELRLHFSFAYLMIAGLVCQLAVPYLAESVGGVVDMVGANLLIVSEALFFIQGLAIGSWFLWRYRVSRPKRLGIFICLALLQVVLSLVSWLGLFDTWVDYRKRFGGKKVGPADAPGS
jgi:uncharacterized protein YybS (DUF2232 family)